MEANLIKEISALLPDRDFKMPVLFIGHGSPMNAIEDNEFTRGWKDIAKRIPRPDAILFISAHWLTRGTYVTAMAKPRTIHDFYGFPADLFAVRYPAEGFPELAQNISFCVHKAKVEMDEQWGLDHGSWSVSKIMYPEADIPAIQLSIDYYKSASFQYELAGELGYLRKKGVLIIASGNMVHNLRHTDFSSPDIGYDWAMETNDKIKKHILERNHGELIHYENMGPSVKLSIQTPDHYFPLLYSLGLQEEDDALEIFNDKPCYGSITMTSVKIG